jgi:hypothetical protein
MWYNTPANSGSTYTYANKKGESSTFHGYIDGGYHTIYCLQSEGFSAGFIPSFGNGSIENLKIDYSIFKATERAGAFIGRTARDAYKNGEVTIKNCVAGKALFIESTTGQGASSFVGYATIGQTTKFESCCSLTPQSNIVSSQDWKANGFTGETYNSAYRFYNCFSVIKPVDIARMDDSNNRLSTLYNPYEKVYSCTTRGKNPGEDDIYTQVIESDVIGFGALTIMPSLYGFVEQYKDYPIISGFDSEAKSSQVVELDG